MSEIDLDLLPASLRSLRQRTGRTQVDVAAAAHVPQANLSRWESGKVCPSLDSLVAVLNALGANFCDLQGMLDGSQTGPYSKPSADSSGGQGVAEDPSEYAFRWLSDLERRVRKLERVEVESEGDGS